MTIAEATPPAAAGTLAPRSAVRANRLVPAVVLGLYLVFPAFYTDVTDSYRLGRPGRAPSAR